MLGPALEPHLIEKNANAAGRRLRSIFIRGSTSELDQRGTHPVESNNRPRPFVCEKNEHEVIRTQPAQCLNVRFDETPLVQTSAETTLGY